MVTPCSTTVWPGRVSSQLPPDSDARSTITEPGFISATIAAVTSTGARRPGTFAVVITTSEVLQCLAVSSRIFDCMSAPTSLA